MTSLRACVVFTIPILIIANVTAAMKSSLIPSTAHCESLLLETTEVSMAHIALVPVKDADKQKAMDYASLEPQVFMNAIRLVPVESVSPTYFAPIDRSSFNDNAHKAYDNAIKERNKKVMAALKDKQKVGQTILRKLNEVIEKTKTNSKENLNLPLVLSGKGFKGSEADACNVIAQVLGATRANPGFFTRVVNAVKRAASREIDIVIKDFNFTDVHTSIDSIANDALLFERSFTGKDLPEKIIIQKVYVESDKYHPDGIHVETGLHKEGTLLSDIDGGRKGASLQLNYVTTFHGLKPVAPQKETPTPIVHQPATPAQPVTPVVIYVKVTSAPFPPPMPTPGPIYAAPAGTPSPEMTDLYTMRPIKMLMSNTDPMRTQGEWFEDLTPLWGTAAGLTITGLIATFYVYRVRHIRIMSELDDFHNTAQPFGIGMK